MLFIKKFNRLLKRNQIKKQRLLAEQLPAMNVEVPKAISNLMTYTETKQILDRVLQARSERKIKNIAILSEFPREGKTMLASTLAIGFGELVQQSVLVVECSTFTSPNSLPLTRALEIDDLPMIKQSDVLLKNTSSPNVCTLNFQEWAEKRAGLPEHHLEEFLHEYSRKFDLLIFDTCAMSVKNKRNFDPIAIARRCDSSVVVVSRRSHNRASLQQVRERIKKEQLQLLGICLNEGVIL